MTEKPLDTREARGDLEAHFGALSDTGYVITSKQTRDYNCIAWAAGDDESWWQPGGPGGYYWPQGLPRDFNLENFIRAFKRQGYRECAGGELEEGWEKIALYTQEGKPSHAARQLAGGNWTSKCGNLEDIEHPLVEDVGGDEGYGDVSIYMRRRRVAQRPHPRARNLPL